jgi:hypothetical protein
MTEFKQIQDGFYRVVFSKRENGNVTERISPAFMSLRSAEDFANAFARKFAPQTWKCCIFREVEIATLNQYGTDKTKRIDTVSLKLIDRQNEK